MTRQFGLTFDYRCPFARNGHEAAVNALRAGEDLDIRFLAFSLDQAHVEEGEPPVWERDPSVWGTGVNALLWGIAVRDAFADRFLDWHIAAFGARHDEGRKIAKVVYDHTDVDDPRKQILIGIPTAGTALAQAAAMVSVSEVERQGYVWTAQPLGHQLPAETRSPLHGGGTAVRAADHFNASCTCPTRRCRQASRFARTSAPRTPAWEASPLSSAARNTP